MTSPAPSNSAVVRLGAVTVAPRLVPGAAIDGSAGMSYRPLLELGEGGMARIVLALATGPSGFSKLVVLKVMRTGQDSTEIRRLLLAEARLSARLNHPNVVQVHEVVHTADAPYLVMEYLDGRPLSALRTSEIITPSMLMTAISETLVGLHHAHELTDFDGTPLNIVHRDVSPHNVFITYDGAVKVLDFGIAKMEHEVSNTETGEIKGKLAYMPPEQLLGDGVDRRADIFAVGGMLWEAATGARMWANVSQANLMHRLISGDIPRPSAVAPIDDELERIIVKATAASPADRYETALAMQRDLDAYLHATGKRVALRDIGAALAEAFRQDRQQRVRVIKEALKHPSIPPAANGQLELVTTSETKPEPRPNRRRLLSALALLALVALGGAFVLRSPREVTAVSAPSAITVTIHASPAEARVKIDQQEYAQPSVSLNPPRDDRAHTIEVFAEGFVSDTHSVKFDKSLVLEVVLQAEPAKAAEAPDSTTRSAQSKTTATPHLSSARHAMPGAAPKAPAAAAECNPPYFFDHGIKTYKPQCL